MEVNGLIFKELMKRGYSLDGKTRVWNIADSKLWYLTPEQAQAYLDVENSEDYKDGASNSEYDLIEKNINEIRKEIGTEPVNIVDLGCGDGKKAAHIIGLLKKDRSIRYCPIDISSYMVREAIKTLSKQKIDEIIDLQYNISDFENLDNITPLLTRGKFKKSLFLLLGYTLGNFEIYEILYQIRGAMSKGDTLIIVSGLGSKKWKEWADDARNHKKSNMDSFFIHTPLQLGFEEKDLDFGARFQNSRVEYYYTVKENKTINFQGKEISFIKGDQIVVAVSYKHEKEMLLSTLNSYFDAVHLKVSKDGATFLAICKKL